MHIFQPTSSSTRTKPTQFDDWSQATEYTKETDAFTALLSYLTLSAQLRPEQRKTIGHHLNTMLMSCSFNGMACSPRLVSCSLPIRSELFVGIRVRGREKVLVWRLGPWREFAWIIVKYDRSLCVTTRERYT